MFRKVLVLVICLLFAQPSNAEIKLEGEALEHDFVMVTSDKSAQWVVIGPNVLKAEKIEISGDVVLVPTGINVRKIIVIDGVRCYFVGPRGDYVVIAFYKDEQGELYHEYIIVKIKPNEPVPPPPPPPTIDISIGDATVNEGDRTAVVPIKLSEPSTLDTILTVRTKDGTAIANQDYVEKVEQVRIPKGVTQGSFAVTIVDDDVQESEENFIVTADNVKDIGTVKIIDDDKPPPPTGFKAEVATALAKVDQSVRDKYRKNIGQNYTIVADIAKNEDMSPEKMYDMVGVLHVRTIDTQQELLSWKPFFDGLHQALKKLNITNNETRKMIDAFRDIAEVLKE